MKRDAYQELLTWSDAPGRKPLLMRGARQTGKTYLLRAFGRERYAASHYFNFEQTPALASLFERDLDPMRIVRDLSVFAGERIVPGGSLLILDEIQACNAALNSLKYFAEDAPQYHVAAAGSLLGVALSTPRSFPVGKVDFVDLHPMTFLEFLDAVGAGRYRTLIEEHALPEPFPEAFHTVLVDLLRAYYFVGGMPEAVARYAANREAAEVRTVQQAILDAYVLDFAKHAPAREVARIRAVWDSLPGHLARENKKFMFSAIRPSARARDYEDAVVWLEGAGLILRAFGVETARLPLRGHADRRSFKVYALDIGLLGALAGAAPQLLVHGDRLFAEYRGALVENYVAQQLAAAAAGDLHYWRSSGGKAEVDFLLERSGEVVPLEVKSGVNPRSKSLRSFDSQFAPAMLVRSTLLNLKRDARVLNIPLYAVPDALRFVGDLDARGSLG
ncbi:MAG: DUF4143 domain-containing protein [Spirochaetaceae bacterium]|nr:DUF4143 domain-containing protein [Spirochaetaceae bacterium]